MGKQQPREDSVKVFQHSPGSNEDFLIDAGSIPAAERGNPRLAALTVGDLKHLIGLRDKNSKDVSDHVKALTIADIHSLGRCFAAHWGMDYPDKIYSCCCCG